MKNHTHLLALPLALWLAAASWPARAGEMPIVFARSGQRTTVPLGGGRVEPDGPVALWAFGQRSAEAVIVKDNAAEFVAPAVRVPVVFAVATAHRGAALAELVVYPDRPPAWDKETQLAAVGTPDWFDTWANAVWLPVQKFKDAKSLAAANWRRPEKPALLVLGPQAAESGLAAVGRLAVEHSINVLVLEADWAARNETAGGESVLALTPKRMTGPLADLQAQRWPLPPTFRQSAVRIANRQTWIAGPDRPLVEELRTSRQGAEPLRTVFSYLPWQRQLGRAEMADGLLLRVMVETAKGAKGRGPMAGFWCLLYPLPGDVKPDERPVLSAAMKWAEAGVFYDRVKSHSLRGYVLDFRGEVPPEATITVDSIGLKSIEEKISPQLPLVILGDNPVLDQWKWLGVDRAGDRPPGGASPRLPPGVLWWPDKPLPASKESQLRLMQLLTEWNVPLETTLQESNDENRKENP